MPVDEKAGSRFKVDRVATSLRHSVAESIRTAIAIRHFEPGQRLIERELCDLTGVSRTLIRETLRQLESEGLVVIQPHRGPVVRELTREQAIGVYAVRAELEGLAASLFVANATPGQMKHLEDAFRQLETNMKDGDQISRLQSKNDFYECLLQGANNEALADTFRMLNARITVLRAASLQSKGRAKDSINELRSLVRYIRDSDPIRAKEAAELHVRNAGIEAVKNLPR